MARFSFSRQNRRVPTSEAGPTPGRIVRMKSSLKRSGVLLLFLAAPAAAKVFLTQEEAMKLAFPGAAVERRTAFLRGAEQKDAAALSGGAAPSALAVAYVATKDGRLVGTAYFDTHVVRTQPETLMVVVTPEGTIARVEVLSFSEPEDYLPRGHWYAQFPGKALDDELSVKRGIRPVAGATLTARATTEAARRVLALHRVLERRAKKAA
jgi:Na+-translocating ferredoxin:NAD+ oxidoreductase RnfG subunit